MLILQGSYAAIKARINANILKNIVFLLGQFA
jgi:hypothetical protein